jgi:hypothetical protein
MEGALPESMAQESSGYGIICRIWATAVFAGRPQALVLFTAEFSLASSQNRRSLTELRHTRSDVFEMARLYGEIARFDESILFFVATDSFRLAARPTFADNPE